MFTSLFKMFDLFLCGDVPVSSFFFWRHLTLKNLEQPSLMSPFPLLWVPLSPQDGAGAAVWQSSRVVAEGGEVTLEVSSWDGKYGGVWCSCWQVAVGGIRLLLCSTSLSPKAVPSSFTQQERYYFWHNTVGGVWLPLHVLSIISSVTEPQRWS